MKMYIANILVLIFTGLFFTIIGANLNCLAVVKSNQEAKITYKQVLLTIISIFTITTLFSLLNSHKLVTYLTHEDLKILFIFLASIVASIFSCYNISFHLRTAALIIISASISLFSFITFNFILSNKLTYLFYQEFIDQIFLCSAFLYAGITSLILSIKMKKYAISNYNYIKPENILEQEFVIPLIGFAIFSIGIAILSITKSYMLGLDNSQTIIKLFMALSIGSISCFFYRFFFHKRESVSSIIYGGTAGILINISSLNSINFLSLSALAFFSGIIISELPYIFSRIFKLGKSHFIVTSYSIIAIISLITNAVNYNHPFLDILLKQLNVIFKIISLATISAFATYYIFKYLYKYIKIDETNKLITSQDTKHECLDLLLKSFMKDTIDIRTRLNALSNKDYSPELVKSFNYLMERMHTTVRSLNVIERIINDNYSSISNLPINLKNDFDNLSNIMENIKLSIQNISDKMPQINSLSDVLNIESHAVANYSKDCFQKYNSLYEDIIKLGQISSNLEQNLITHNTLQINSVESVKNINHLCSNSIFSFKILEQNFATIAKITNQANLFALNIAIRLGASSEGAIVANEFKNFTKQVLDLTKSINEQIPSISNDLNQINNKTFEIEMTQNKLNSGIKIINGEFLEQLNLIDNICNKSGILLDSIKESKDLSEIMKNNLKNLINIINDNSKEISQITKDIANSDNITEGKEEVINTINFLTYSLENVMSMIEAEIIKYKF